MKRGESCLTVDGRHAEDVEAVHPDDCIHSALLRLLQHGIQGLQRGMPSLGYALCFSDCSIVRCSIGSLHALTCIRHAVRVELVQMHVVLVAMNPLPKAVRPRRAPAG